MSPPPTFRRPSLLGACLLSLGIALLAAPGMFGQSTGGGPNTSGGGGDPGANQSNNGGTTTDGGTTTGGSSTSASVGYLSITSSTIPSASYSFVTGISSSTVTLVPFSFNSLGNYSLASVNLLLSSASGTTNRSSLSLSVFSTLPTSLSLPTALVTFPSTGTISTSAAVLTFTAGSSPTLAANTTYYLGVTATGATDVNWLTTTGSTNPQTYTADLPVTTTYANGTAFVYHSLTSSGTSNLYDNMGGYSITANAVSAIPEPASFAAVAAVSMLALALVVSRRRRTGSPAATETPPEA